MKKWENDNHLNRESQMPVNMIQMLYALYIFGCFRWNDYGTIGNFLGLEKQVGDILLTAIFVISTICILVYNHKREKSKMIRIAFYFAAALGVYDSIAYFFF